MLVVVATAGQALAQEGRIAVVEPGEALEVAVRAGLSPWGVDVVAVPAPSPGAVMPDSGEAAARVARAHGADAVVWVSASEGGHALWMYEARDARVVARRLAGGPPFDEPTAAAVALSVKTLLRHSSVAPPRERWSAPEPPGEPEPSSSAPGATPAADAPREADGPVLALRAASAGRARRTRPAEIEPRLGLGLVWWPGAGELFGVAVDVASGPGVSIADRRFEGRLLDNEATLSAIVRASLVGPTLARAELGVGAQLSLLDGAVLEAAVPVEVWRINPTARAALGLDWRAAAGLVIGLRGGISLLGRTQRYLVRGNEVLSLAPVALDAAVYVEAGAF